MKIKTPKVVAITLLVMPVIATGDISYSLQYTANNLNPWDTGTAFSVGENFNLLDYSWNNVTLPALNGDPGSAFMDFIGLSDLASVKLTASTSGNINLNAGYHVNGGVLDLNYGGKAIVSAPDTYAYGQPLMIGTGFNQGTVITPSPNYGVSPQRFESGFTTTTPFADAYANIHINVSAGASVEGCLLLYCDNATIGLPGVTYNNQLLNASTVTGVSALGINLLNFGQTTNLGGWGSLTVNSPSINVTGTPQADGTLSGGKTGNVLDLTFNGDQLIPVIGPLLQNNIGPVGYSLVSFTPEVTLGVHQNLQFTPNLQTELQFSTPMLQILSDGTRKIIDAGAPVSVNMGDPFNLRPITFQSYFDQALTVKPTVISSATIHNTTELTLAGDLVVDGLTLKTPFGNAGPLPNPDPIPIFSSNIPVWDKTFNVDLAAMLLPTFEITNRNSPFKQVVTNGGFKYEALLPPDPSGNTQFKFSLEQASGLLDWTATGQLINSSAAIPECNDNDIPGHSNPASFCTPEQFFVADHDVIIDLYDENYGFVPFDLGSVFCVVCNDVTEYLNMLANSLPGGIADDNSLIFMSDPALFLTGDNSNPNDPWLTQDHAIYSLETTPLKITVSSTVPEPGTLVLFGIGLVGLLGSKFSSGDRKSLSPHN